MILPIYVNGSEILRQKAKPVEGRTEELDKLIDDMFDTMAEADGIGLAAPQIGKSLNLFVVCLEGFESEEFPIDREMIKETFINPEILEESEETVPFKEGCLSVPGINENVIRPKEITVRYWDREWKEHEEHFTGIWARVIQHEYDHLNGRIFTDSISTLRKQLISSKLKAMAHGKYSARYKTKHR